MHTFTYVSKVTYISKFTYGACERTYSREYKYSWSKLGQVKVYLHHLWRSCKSIFTYKYLYSMSKVCHVNRPQIYTGKQIDVS